MTARDVSAVPVRIAIFQPKTFSILRSLAASYCWPTKIRAICTNRPWRTIKSANS